LKLYFEVKILNKRIFLIFLFCIFLFAACGTNKIYYSGLSPNDETSTIMPNASIRIIAFNGDIVNWAPGFWGGTEITIPAGEAEVVLSLIDADMGRVIYNGGAFRFKYIFQSGHSYFFMIDKVLNEEEVRFIIQDKTKKTKDTVYGKQV
jgi:hypothetical protein